MKSIAPDNIKVCERPKGFPIATAFWPTIIVSVSPNSAIWVTYRFGILMIAKSDVGSIPINKASTFSPVTKVTEIFICH
jgi:hypothetical protein